MKKKNNPSIFDKFSLSDINDLYREPKPATPGEGLISTELIEVPVHPERLRVQSSVFLTENWEKREAAQKALRSYFFSQLRLSRKASSLIGDISSRGFSFHFLALDNHKDWIEWHPAEKSFLYEQVYGLNNISLCLRAEELALELVRALSESFNQAEHYPTELYLLHMDDAVAIDLLIDEIQLDDDDCLMGFNFPALPLVFYRFLELFDQDPPRWRRRPELEQD